MPDVRPLHSVESEEGVLSCMLQFSYTVPTAVELLKSEMFVGNALGKLFGVLADLFAQGRTVDVMTTRAELEARGLTDTISGLMLANLLDAVPTGAGAEDYCRTIRDLYALRNLVTTCRSTLADIEEPTTLSASEVLDRAETRLLDASGIHSPRREVTLGTATSEALERLRERERTGAPAGISTGFPDLDQMTSGLKPGELILVAGRPSMGKTSLATAFCTTAAKSKTVLMFSLEQSQEELAERLLRTEARSSDLDEMGRAATRMRDLKLLIDDSPGATVLAMRAKARRIAQTHDLGMICVDYIQLMTGDRRTDSRVQEISDISRGLKLLAKELKVPVVALSQLSRATESRSNHRPTLSDLRDSGSLEQDADVVMFLLRPEYYLSHDEAVMQGLVGATELIIAKQRNGPTGDVGLIFDAAHTRFESLHREPSREAG